VLKGVKIRNENAGKKGQTDIKNITLFSACCLLKRLRLIAATALLMGFGEIPAGSDSRSDLVRAPISNLIRTQIG